MNYPLIALDSAIGTTVACLVDAQGNTTLARGDEQLQHSRSMLPLLQQLMQACDLDWQDIQGFIYAQGPGSFTGLRIAAATIAGLNASLKRPVFQVSSLAITAIQSQTDDVWVVEDARASELFVGHYVQGQSVQDDVCVTIAALEIPKHACVATHIEDKTLLQKIMGTRKQMELRISRAKALACVVQQQAGNNTLQYQGNYAEPVYLQLSQAERNAYAR